MTTWVIGTHDGWQHSPVASVVADEMPELVLDSDWAVAIEEGYMEAEELTALEVAADMANDGSLCWETGMHQPYMDGTAREGYGFLENSGRPRRHREIIKWLHDRRKREIRSALIAKGDQRKHAHRLLAEQIGKAVKDLRNVEQENAR